MTDKEKLEAIRAEIHRLVHINGYSKEMANELFAFINSLPEEPVSEDLEEAADNYASVYKQVGYDEDHILSVSDSYIAGANWQKGRDIDNACEFFYHRILDVGDVEFSNIENFINDFKKYLEDK